MKFEELKNKLKIKDFNIYKYIENKFLSDRVKNKKKKYNFDYYFGLPGSGKTTFAAYLTKNYQRRKIDVYSNVVIKGCYEVQRRDLGRYLIEDGLLIIDEASVEHNNRTQDLSKEEIKFYKYHRHFHLDVAIFSQSFDDVDVTLRRLSNRMFYLVPSKIPFFIKRKQLCKKIDINKDTHQIEVQYYWKFLGTKRIFSPLLWKMFDSHSIYTLPKKKFFKYE